jgi:putative acetyltransferase
VSGIRVRAETPADHEHVDAIQRAAFGRDEEAALVRALRARVSPQVSLVAETSGEVVGHVFLSPVTIEGPLPSPPVGGLAPVGVAPAHQGRGVGAALVGAGLREAARLGWQAVFLLGDPAYYARFGFRLAAPDGLRYESELFDAAFQVVELVPGALADHRGWIRYPEAFAGV